MERAILDTNIYGLIVVDEDRDKIRYSIQKKEAIIVYGLPVIRKELRDTPKSIRIGGANLRIALLGLYDELTKNRTLKFMSESEKLANNYLSIYKEIGGYASKVEIIKDLTIVACASLNSLDIVVSNDNKTMLSEVALKSYKIVNQLKKIRTPRFLNYEEFKKDIK